VDAVRVVGEGNATTEHQQTFCAYSNTDYNNGRGVSFVVTPEVAASVTFETFGMAIGGLEAQIGEEMGMWEVNETKDRGLGLFAKKDIGAIFAGESLITKTPVLFVQKDLLETKKMIEKLARSWGGAEAFDITMTNAQEVTWPWVDDVPKLLAITPEVAVSSQVMKYRLTSNY
jgi:hypothetical protein